MALAVSVAPQLSLVHALTHVTASAQGADERQQAPDKACDACVLLAHLGQALTAQHTWTGLAFSAPAPLDVKVAQVALPAEAHFQARAPPSLL